MDFMYYCFYCYYHASIIFIHIYNDRRILCYKYTNCKALHWNYPVHKFDTLSGKEWNSLRIYDVNASKLEELLAFAEMNAWKLLPLTDIEKDDSFLKDYPDQNISLMKEAQTGYWKRGEGYLCIFDAESATLYIRSSSIIE